MSNDKSGYVKVSVKFWSNPKIMRMQLEMPQACIYYIRALSYAGDTMTNGDISRDVALYTLQIPTDVIDYLTTIRLLDETETGWHVHDYTKHQNTKEQILAKRESARERKAKSRRNHGGTASDAPVTEPEPQADVSEPEPQSHDCHNDVTCDNHPVTPMLLNKELKLRTKTKNSSSKEEEVANARARETAATAEEPKRRESMLIDSFEPGPVSRSRIDELERQGVGIDVRSLLDTFRRKLHARGLAAYKLPADATHENLDYEFSNWVTRQPEYDAERAAKLKGTPTPPVSEPQGLHVHSADCVDVRTLVLPYSGRYPKSADGMGESPDLLKLRRTVAAKLNAGEHEEDVDAWLKEHARPAKARGVSSR